jgi:predicted aspartyl protease
VQVAGGESIKAQDITLDALRVGPHTLRNVRTLIIRHKSAQTSVQGFLGMDFLGQFPFSIDMQQNMIHWKGEIPATAP